MRQNGGELKMSVPEDYLDAIQKILAELNSSKNCERILHNIIAQLVKTLDIKTCAIVELNPETEFLEIRKSHNLSYNFCKNYRKAIDSPLLNALIWQGEPISIPDSKYALRVVQHLRMEHEFVSAYVTPLVSQQQPLGFLYVDSDALNYFNQEHKQVVDVFAEVISICLFWDRLNHKLKKMRVEDEETGTMRFEHYLPYLKENFHRSLRMNEPYSILLLDIEKFGNLMTMYGLKTVQGILKEVVEEIKVQLRKYDGICRFGADEFLISLPAVSRADAFKVAEKIVKLFDETKFSAQKLNVGVFIGVASFPENAKSFNGLLMAVKNALQEAKRKDQHPKIATIETLYD